MSWQASIAARIGSFEIDVDIRTDKTVTVILGPNGSGKTTLLRFLAGAYRPQHGRIAVGGRIIFDAKQRVEIAPEDRGIGYVPQGYGLFPHLSVIDNVAFGLKRSTSKSWRRRTAMDFLKELQCAELAQRMPASLSGGEQQRVALARALVKQPQLLLLDEPLAALDASARRTLRSFLASHLRRRGDPSIVVTHDVRDVVVLDAHVVVIEGGRVAQRGSVAELKHEPATDFVAEFFGV